MNAPWGGPPRAPDTWGAPPPPAPGEGPHPLGATHAGPPLPAPHAAQAGAWPPPPAAAPFPPVQGGGVPPGPALAGQAHPHPALALNPWASVLRCPRFPRWDGSPHTKAYFVARIRAYKEDPFFAPVRDSSDGHHPGWREQSRLLYVEMMGDNLLPREMVDTFIGKPVFTSNGVGMLTELLRLLDPSTPATMLEAVDAVCHLDLADKAISTFMREVRGFAATLQGVTFEALLPLMVMVALDRERFAGLVARYKTGDPAVVGATLETLEGILLECDGLRHNIDAGGAVLSARQGASRSTARAPTPAPIPAPSPDRATGQAAVPWPPIKVPHYDDWKAYYNSKKPRLCPVCLCKACKYSGGCLTLAQMGLVIVDDAAAAKKIRDTHAAGKQERGGPTKGGRKKGGSAQRATSGEREGFALVTAGDPHAAASPRSGNGAPSAPAPAPTGRQGGLWSDFESVDSESEYSETLADLDSSNLGLSSAPYSLPCGIRPPQSPTRSRVARKWARKCVNRAARKARRASARRAAVPTTRTWADVVASRPSAASLRGRTMPRSARPPRDPAAVPSHPGAPRDCAADALPSSRARRAAATPSSTLAALANDALQSSDYPSHAVVADEDEACADTGATGMMLQDYAAFVSYHKVADQHVELGDDTRLPIAGVGTAKFSLNGKVVRLRDCMHVPGLRAPLYSLRRHRHLPGCGTFSHFDSGSFVLFPTFSLRVDDSVDHMLSYRSIGRAPHVPCDYVEPRRAPPAARAAAVVVEDDEHSASSSASTVVTDNRSGCPASGAAADAGQTAPPPRVVDEDAETIAVSDEEALADAAEPLTPAVLSTVHDSPAELPDVRPCNVPAPCESRVDFDNLTLHRIFGCRRFRNQRHVTAASANAKLVHGGELPPTLGAFTTITNPPKGKPLRKRRKFLDKVHMDIVYGDCLSLGGFRYALLLVDVATRYCWIYGMPSLTSSHIIHAFDTFKSDVGRVPKKFHTDFDKKLIGGDALRWILNSGSKVVAANAGRQSSNGLAERTWRTIVVMARAYITEKHVGREFWFFAVQHAASMLNQVPGRLGRKLTSPFEVVHGVKPDARTWFELFSVGYFSHPKDGGESRSNSQDQSLDGIAVGRDDKTNTVLFYNPQTRSYYRPPAFKLDEGRLPVTNFPQHVRYDGGLTCGFMRNRTDPVPEPFPPGTRVTITRGDSRLRGTIQRVPLPESFVVSSAATPGAGAAPDDGASYTIHLDSGETTDAAFEELVAAGRTDAPPTATPADPFASLPVILQRNAKVTLDHNGAFHKGYLQHTPDAGFAFVVRRNPRSLRVDWSVPLPDFKQRWTTLVGENVLVPGHTTVSSFLRPLSSRTAHSANLVSAKNLLSQCPPSLVKALDPSNPDRDIWLQSYNEEKDGLIANDTYERISKKRYLALRRANVIPKAIPSMCVLVVKPDKDGNQGQVAHCCAGQPRRGLLHQVAALRACAQTNQSATPGL